MKQDRFLTGILIGIGVLVVVALALFFARQGKQTYMAGDTPEAVVFNYALGDHREGLSESLRLPGGRGEQAVL